MLLPYHDSVQRLSFTFLKINNAMKFRQPQSALSVFRWYGLAALAVSVALLAPSHAFASYVVLSAGVSPNPHPIDRTGNGESFTLQTALTDWLLATGNRKLNGAITTTGSSTASFADYPNFTYTNGTSPTSATEENGTYRYVGTGGSFTISIPLAAGTGGLILWLGATSNNTASFSVDLPDTTAVDYSTNFGVVTSQQFFLNYQTDVAETATVTITPGTNANAGFFAVGVNPAQFVPEPSTWALLGLGFAGLGIVTLRRRVPVGRI